MSVNSDGVHGVTEAAQGSHLGRRSLGVADIVFFVVAASAPLTVVAGGVPTSFAVTQLLGIPLVYVIIAAILLVFAVGYAAMSRHVANSGAFYTYVSKGLGRAWGVSAALVALVAYNAMQVGIFGLYGSNTWLPGQGSRIGFAIMIAIVLAVTAGSVLLLQRWQRDRGPGT